MAKRAKRKQFEYGSYEITRKGQQTPSTSDLVVVVGAVYLPHPIPPEIRFGPRLTIDGEDLFNSWGHHCGATNRRKRYREFVSDTWRAAESDAEQWCTTELQRLADMVAARREALRLADEPDEPSEPKPARVIRLQKDPAEQAELQTVQAVAE